ncbi:MAG: aminotransferase class I/II-fold pyridoxal phosphate-dependent enzyme [Saccharofermentanales bacterium]
MQDIPLDHTPIIKMLASYLEKESVSFHMPGHTNGELFSGWLHENALSIDTTELDITDDLHNPANAFQEASRLAADAFGAKETYFITTGATTAVYAAFLCSSKPSDKIVLFRNVHKSVLNACMLLNLHPVFTTEDGLDETLVKNPDARLVFLTRPDYFGRCVDIAKIAVSVHNADMLLLVDEAHGTHFHFCPELLPPSAVTHGADIVIHSAHKTTPALTQAAFIHISHDAYDSDRIKKGMMQEAISMISTSSPSFLIAATCDFARAYLQEYGKIKSFELFSDLEYFFSLLSPEWLRSIERFGESDIGVTYDPFRLVLNCAGMPFTSAEVAGELADNGIYIEFHDLSRIVMICKFGNTRDDFTSLARILNGFSALHIPDNILEAQSDIRSLDHLYKETFKHFPLCSLSPSCGLTMAKSPESVILKASAQRVMLKAVIPYPPGVPIIWPGEVMNEEIIGLIEGLLRYGLTIYGVDIYKDDITGEISPHVYCVPV